MLYAFVNKNVMWLAGKKTLCHIFRNRAIHTVYKKSSHIFGDLLKVLMTPTRNT